MSQIKQHFSITDLENFSNIKAHTIRIWEKRYNLFSPTRNENSMARTYDLEDLKKILNVVFLNNLGYKISKIAALKDTEIHTKIVENLHQDSTNTGIVNNFKISMLDFNKKLFNETFENLRKKYSFVEVYVQFFIPLLTEIGYLWQANAINSTHEHFISYLIIQKIKQETAKVEDNFESNTMYVLFLAENEFHEVSILFINYYLNLNQKNTLYLGQTIITNDIFVLNKKFEKICFITNITHQTGKDQIQQFIDNFFDKNIKNTQNIFVLTNNLFERKEEKEGKIQKFQNVKEMLDFLI